MPLHLLGKKSWNVYNSANIERVRRDEAEAAAREEADEHRLQQEDAAARISILRGEQPARRDSDQTTSARRIEEPRRSTRRRRGEDDTDLHIRLARERAEEGRAAQTRLSRHDDTPIEDQDGHIQLVPVPDAATASKIEKNVEREAELARKRKRDEDQYTMRFSNAAGFNNNMSPPWYADATKKGGQQETLQAVADKDVWGNEDPRRREREQKRVLSNDPMAMMQQAQRQLKQSQRDRDNWKAERDAELKDLDREQRHPSRYDDPVWQYSDERRRACKFNYDPRIYKKRSRRESRGEHKKRSSHDSGHHRRSPGTSDERRETARTKA